MIAGIVLAAGRSRRMGEPKALLEIDGETFLALAVGALQEGGCRPVLVVTGPPELADARRIAAAARMLRARVVENLRSRSQQIDSLRAGLRELGPRAEAAVVSPVDVPRVRTETVRALIAAFRERGAPIVVPTYNGSRGHPTLFARSVFGELLEGRPREGARSVIECHAADVEEVAVEDDSVIGDVNTRGEYQRLLRERP